MVTFLAGLLSGGAGFGYAILSAPFLLLIGFSPPFVITANLSVGILTRVGVTWNFRQYVSVRRVIALTLSSAPGMLIGLLILTRVDPSLIARATGAIAIVAALGLFWSTSRTGSAIRIPGGLLIAGFIGGVLGTTTSLSGIPPAIYLIRERLEPIRFIADMAAFFVFGNLVALLILVAGGALVTSALFPAALVWLPGALVGNLVGARIGSRLPQGVFRVFALIVVFIAGIVTIVTS
jgi:uncharacterized protein